MLAMLVLLKICQMPNEHSSSGFKRRQTVVNAFLRLLILLFFFFFKELNKFCFGDN